MTTDAKRSEDTQRWEAIRHNLMAFGQAMYLTVDELVNAMVWLNGRGHPFSIHTLHLRADPGRYHIKRD